MKLYCLTGRLFSAFPDKIHSVADPRLPFDYGSPIRDYTRSHVRIFPRYITAVYQCLLMMVARADSHQWLVAITAGAVMPHYVPLRWPLVQITPCYRGVLSRRNWPPDTWLGSQPWRGIPMRCAHVRLYLDVFACHSSGWPISVINIVGNLRWMACDWHMCMTILSWLLPEGDGFVRWRGLACTWKQYSVDQQNILDNFRWKYPTIASLTIVEKHWNDLFENI